jgi:MFS family permease
MQIFRLHPGEASLVFILGFALLVNSLAMQIAGIVAISGFLNTGGVNQILLVLFVDYALVLVLGALYSLAIDKLKRIRFLQMIILAFALFFVVLRLMFYFNSPGWLNYSIIYILAEQQFILFPLVFWVLANDIFKIAQTKRLFPLISGWNFAGKLIGIGIAGISPSLFAAWGFASEEILVFNFLIYVLAFLIITIGLRNVETRDTVQQEETISQTLREGWDFIRNVPSFRYMMIFILGIAFADTIIEFRFFVVTDAVFQDQTAYQTFFSIYRLVVTLLAIVIQAFLTSQIIRLMQLKNTFLILPLIAIAAVLGMILVPGVSVVVVSMAGVKLIRDTVNESSRKSFQGLVPEERRGRVSTLMESYFPSIGTMLACMIAGAIVYFGVLRDLDLKLGYLLVSGIGGVVAFWAVLKMRVVYDASLLSWRLKRRQRKADSVLLRKIAD